MTQNPTIYCSTCRTDKPPLFARRAYRCVMCGKTRNLTDYRVELDQLKQVAVARPVMRVVPSAPAPRVSTPVCAWEGCENEPRSKSKYCSRNCSNRNARARHATRKAS